MYIMTMEVGYSSETS